MLVSKVAIINPAVIDSHILRILAYSNDIIIGKAVVITRVRVIGIATIAGIITVLSCTNMANNKNRRDGTKGTSRVTRAMRFQFGLYLAFLGIAFSKYIAVGGEVFVVG